MALHDPVHLRQAEARAAFALRGEEWLEDPRLDLGRHARTGIGHFDDDLVVHPPRAQADGPAMRQCVDRVEHQIDECLAHAVRPPFDEHLAGDVDA